MNEIITKLNEIEEKAVTILLDAKEDKEQMQQRLTQQMKELDAHYDRLEKERSEAFRAQLMAKAREQTKSAKDETRTALAQLSSYYDANGERLVEEIMQRILK